MKAELHSAFVFDCDECGVENFVRAIEANLQREHALEVAEDLVSNHFECVAEPDENGEVQSPYIIVRTAIAPRFITCTNCGKTYESHLVSERDDVDP